MSREKRRILILIGGHLSTAPRPLKEANALAEAGHDVRILGGWSDGELAARDLVLARDASWRFDRVYDVRPNADAATMQAIRDMGLDPSDEEQAIRVPSMREDIARFMHRLHRRMALEAYRRYGVATASIYGYAVRDYLARALRYKADLTIAHMEAGLWVGSVLLKRGYRVGVDFEDWFSEDLPPETRKNRPIEKLREFEGLLLRRASYRLATSHAMADALAQAYEVPAPTVVYNTFPPVEPSGEETADDEDGDARANSDVPPGRTNPEIPSLHWFSQTIGPGRGLEELFQALAEVDLPLELHLRGKLTDRHAHWLEDMIPPGKRGRVFIHPTVPPDRLHDAIARHDIGLALETDRLANKDVTVSNKFFQYMQAGLAVIATDTQGQREVFEGAPERIGALVPCNDSEALAAALREIVGDRDRLEELKKASRKAWETRFNWETQKHLIQEAAAKALADDRSGRH